MRTDLSATPELRALRALARYETHGGYVFAALTTDGKLLCVPCVRGNYRQIFRATRDRSRDGWGVAGATHSGNWESPEHCAHCGEPLNESEA